ncbi:hypothetical protein PDJ95_29785 [Bacillus cereus]|nr:hypothetical protein [Bacillus cereus]
MKKTLTSVLTLAIVAVSLPVTALAADHSDPVTKNGERLKYNTPYYLKDKTLPDKGGVTIEPWVLDDFVLFSNSSTDNGDPIVFENEDGTEGFITSTDKIRIKSTKFNKSGLQYWARDTLIGSVYLSYDKRADHIIYGSSNDNSIGIGTVEESIGRSNGGIAPSWSFYTYKGGTGEKAWIKPIDQLYLYNPKDNGLVLNLNDKQTPFEVIEVSE